MFEIIFLVGNGMIVDVLTGVRGNGKGRFSLDGWSLVWKDCKISGILLVGWFMYFRWRESIGGDCRLVEFVGGLVCVFSLFCIVG